MANHSLSVNTQEWEQLAYNFSNFVQASWDVIAIEISEITDFEIDMIIPWRSDLSWWVVMSRILFLYVNL